MKNILSKEDIKTLNTRGISPEEIQNQINNFISGFPHVHLIEPATVKNGIFQLSPKRMNDNIEIYEDFSSDHKIVKFVPSSGAASRMFKNLIEFRNKYRATSEDQLELLMDKGPDSLYYFFEHLEEFAFFEKLYKAMYKRGVSYEDCKKEQRYEKILNSLLTDKGLGYSTLPKALIPFHKYGKEVRTAFAEQLTEAVRYGRSKNNTCHLHFTIAPDQLDYFTKQFELIRENFENRYQCRFEVEYSVQDPATDTVVVDLKNNPLRDDSGNIVFRPGGHGSLINNLNSISADLIIIKNIDNVCHDRFKDDTYYYKMVLGGMLVYLKEQIFSFLKGLDSHTSPSAKVVDSMMSFVEKKLQIIPPSKASHWHKDQKIEYLKEKLNRPIRICGMVDNEGEQGGGPFWVEAADGSCSLQIVEAAQTDMENKEQVAILNNSTHFNPVDIVCCINNYHGETFKLSEFINPDTGFISSKTFDGKEIQALERPGLWNGGMANWISVFVEVPLNTFNPVKGVNDLLREQHQEHSG